MEKIFNHKSTPFIIIAVLGFVLYFQALFFDFSYLDDNTLILDSKNFLSNLSNIPVAFQSDVFHLFNHNAAYYRPLLTISFMFDYQFGGVTPFMYHFTNIFLHIITACLIFVFFKKLNYEKYLSFLFSIIFLIHPVLTQAVAWIPGRNDSLLAIFILAAFIFFIDYLKNLERKYLIRCLIFSVLALLTKETALLILPAFLFYFYFSGNTEKNIGWKKIFIFTGSLVAVIAAWFLIRHNAIGNGISMSLSDMINSVYLNFPATIQFIGKIFFPFNLTVLPIIQDTSFVYGVIAIILLAFAIFFTKTKRFGMIFFGAVWFFAFLLPSFIRPNPALTADFIEHRLYVPIIGFFIILLETDIVRRFNYKKTWHLIIVGFIMIAFCTITIFHSRNFVDRLSFWKNAVEHSPHYPLAHRNLGAMLFLDGKTNEAELGFKKALELNPAEEMAHNNLGLIYANANKLSEAEEEYKKELAINPYYDNALFNLGLLYYKEEKYEKAEKSWIKTLEANPDYSDALYALASIYYNQKKYGEATKYANEIKRRGLPLQYELQKLIGQPAASEQTLNIKGLN